MRAFFLLLIILFIILTIQLFISKIPPIKIAIMTDAALMPVSEAEYATTSQLIVLIDGNMIEVPTGFRTTLNAIPHYILNPFKPNTLESAIMHDYLYHCPGNLTRMEADAILYNSLLTEGVSSYQAQKYYFLVRIFGGRYFLQNSSCYPNPDLGE